ncbi:MAG: SDR family oxidoreductase [Oscillospiraceae bacterium]|jgi:NAD(P)-dependent dehydrogenase (short-subunit alcohol dehydrogenase family)|nr:SDR family oxidoreductase [Oscillospiraceae bacterium]
MKYQDYGFEGKSAIITGAGTGIGKACAIELAKGGAKVALFGRRPEPLMDTLDECLEFTDDVLAWSADVSDRVSVVESVGEVVKKFGGVDILINNAGIESRLKPGQTFDDLFETFDEESYLQFFKIHSMGHYFMNLEVIPYMQKKHFGRIVNITSVTGLNGQYSSPPYTSSKAAAIIQTKAFARRYGKDNITVNSISPGMVNTPMKIDSTPEEFALVANLTPLRKVAEPVDIARVAMFFAQEELFVSGQNLVVDGGSN